MSLEHRYSALWPTILDALESAANGAGVTGKEWKLVCVSIRNRPGLQAVWEPSYETEAPPWHFTVRMRGWAIVDVVAEC